MKLLLFILLVPILAFGQTVHIENDKIIYKGTVKMENPGQEELFARAKKAMLNHVTKNVEASMNDRAGNKIAGRGNIRLKSPYYLIKTVEFDFELTVKNGEYSYRIDSVVLKQIERGGKTILISSEDL